MVRPAAMKLAVLLLWLPFAFGLALPSAEAAAASSGEPANSGVPAVSAASDAVSSANLTRAEAQHLLEVLLDPAKRAALIGTLEALVKALPAGAVPIVAAAGNTAAPQAQTPAPKVELAPNSLGAEIVRASSSRIAILSGEALATARSLTDFPLLWRWGRALATDQAAQRQLAAAGWRLLVVFGVAFGAERLAAMLLRRPRRLIGERGEPLLGSAGTHAQSGASAGQNALGDIDAAQEAAEAGESEFDPRRPSALALLRRVPFVLLALALELIPVALFALCAYGLLAAVAAEPTARLAILSVVEPYLAWRLVLCLAGILLAPTMPGARLLHVSDDTARHLFRWVGLIVGVAVLGRAVADVTVLYGLHPVAAQALFKLFMLAAHLLLVLFVLRNRRAIGERIRDRSGRTGPLARARNVLARIWSHIAIFYIVAVWLVWAFELPNGYSRLLRVFVVTATILIAGRLLGIVLLGVLDRAMRLRPDRALEFPELATRAHRYHAILHRLLGWLVGALTVLALLQAWGVDVGGWFSGAALGGRALGALAIIGLAVIGSVVVWETANLSAQRHLRRLTEAGQGARAARLRTLLPILRAVLLVTVGTFATLTALAEIGFNIGPLLAGAGIVGVAVGFGSQKLVQDFITGIFLLFENAMQVGDTVTVAGLSGVVENLSIRTIRLRGGDGSVHIIPFSSVTTVNNANRGLGNASVSVNVACREDTDRVGRVLKEIAADMRQEPEFQREMLGELELWGVDKVEGSAVTISGQIVCTDAGRWPVQREFNRRMKRRFEELGIALATPTQTIVLQHEDRATYSVLSQTPEASSDSPALSAPRPFIPAAGVSRR